MAQMHPPELPIAVLADPARRAEVGVYQLFAQKLDDSFHVFFRPTVDGMDPDHLKVADFVLLHNKYGLLGVAVGDDSLPYAGTELKPLPYAPIRSAIRSLIFALKEQGIRFYIPAPCCVLFLNSKREQYQPPASDMEYTPLFQADFADLQNRIIGLMPISAGYQSTWRVPDAVEKIMPFLQTASPLTAKARMPATIDGHTHQIQVAPAAVVSATAAAMPQGAAATNGTGPETRQPVIYVVRAIDIVLAFATIVALIMLISFVPEGVVRRIVDYSHKMSEQHTAQRP